MNFKNYIYILFLLNSSFLFTAQKPENYLIEAENFLKNHTLTDNEKSLIAQALYDTVNCFQKTSNLLKPEEKAIQNTDSFKDLAENFASNFSNLSKPLGELIAQAQAYHEAIYKDLASKNKLGTLKQLETK